MANGFLELTARRLKFRSQLGLEYENTVNEEFVPICWPAISGQPDGYSAIISFLMRRAQLFETIGNDHRVNVVAGFSYQTYLERSQNANVRDWPIISGQLQSWVGFNH